MRSGQMLYIEERNTSRRLSKKALGHKLFHTSCAAMRVATKMQDRVAIRLTHPKSVCIIRLPVEHDAKAKRLAGQKQRVNAFG